MKTFLENICDEILSKHKQYISDVCVIFPSRRAGLYFKNILGNKLNVPIWSPDIYSIEDFIEEFSTYNFADNFKLLIELYTAYKYVLKDENTLTETEKSHVPDEDVESFDSFYPWGEMLLKDFDVIDKYLVDVNLLFKSIKDLKDIEENFPLELQENFKKFWGTLFESKHTNAKENFLKIWHALGKVYVEFTGRLNNAGICYPGMAYRKMFKELESISVNFKWKRIIFAGFNSLNPVEKKMMKSFTDKGIAEIYWDADDYYVLDKNQEAGSFIRKNLKFLNYDNYDFEKNLIIGSKKINIIGTSSSVGMAKVLGSEIIEHLNVSDFSIEKTAIVLPDEKLLLPVLYSTPDGIKYVNITMGFPFRDTPLYSLLCLLIELQNDYLYEKGKFRFNYLIVQKLLLHPYIKFHNTAKIYEIINKIKDNNIVYIGLDDLSHDVPGILKIVFEKTKNLEETINYLSKIIDVISAKIDADESKDSDYKKFQLEFIYDFYMNFNRLNEVLKDNEVMMEVNTYFKLLKNVLKKIFVPFTGEPLKGIQVMGLLETRALDFENVFILSANEGVLPGGRTQNSFIPYSIRKAFKLPTYEDEDSITAYYFYRLIQRAQNIFILYNTEIGNEVREKSRYILQIENELIYKNNNITLVNKIVLPELYGFERKSIEIIKNLDVQNKIFEIKHYSPSTLIKYINCPLQFYFSKIAKLEEDVKIEESFSSKALGNVLHFIFEYVYSPYKKKEISEKIIEDIILLLQKDFGNIFEIAVRSCISEYLLNVFKGKNYLFKDIIYKLLIRVFENEKTLIPFKIIDLEKEIKSTFNFISKEKEIKIEVMGRIDRIDEKNDITRIIDYKTGSFKLNKYDEGNPSEYFEKLISNPDYKENFQAFFYAYFYSKECSGKKINASIYPVKKMNEGIKELKDGFLGNEEFDLFEEVLKKLMSEIYDFEIPFKQTEDEKHCAYCPYSGICYRDLKNTI